MEPRTPENLTDHPELRIGDWVVLPALNLVRRGEDSRRIEPRLMHVLVHLARRPGRVVPRDELLDAVWGDAVVMEEALTQAVSQLRRILGDDPRRPRIIETIRKRGYRIAAPVAVLDAAGGETVVAGARRRAPWLALPAVALLVAAALLLTGRPADTTALVLDELPLTSLEGDETEPALSPDGSSVVFSWRPPGEDVFRLYRMPCGSQTPTPLPEVPGHAVGARWSPDGGRIAFVSRTATGDRIHIAPAAGGEPYPVGPSFPMVLGLDWLPGGDALVLGAYTAPDAPTQLLTLDLKTAAAIPLTLPPTLIAGDSWPRVSRDGSEIAFVRGDRAQFQDVHIIPIAGGDVARLTRGMLAIRGFDWTRDGGRIVVSTEMGGVPALWRVSRDGGEPVRLVARGDRVLYPCCAAGSDRLVFRTQTLDTDLMLCRLPESPDGIPDLVSVAPSTRLDLEGRLDPDGRRIVFISQRDGRSELWLCSVEGRDLRRLSEFGGAALDHPRWSPDGRRVAVNAAADGVLHIFVVDVENGRRRQVTRGARHFRFGHWSADGRWLYHSTAEGKGWRIARTRDDGSETQELDIPACLTLDETVGGEVLYFKDTAPGIWRLPPGGGVPETCVADPDSLGRILAADACDDGLFLVRRVPDGLRLSFLAFGGRGVEDLAELPEGVFGDLSVSRDRRSFLLARVERSQSDLALVEALP